MPMQTNESTRQVDLPLQVRSASFIPSSVNKTDRTAELVWSTGAAVMRSDWWSGNAYEETLSLDEKHVDLSRLNGGAPFLNSHRSGSLESVLGVVERAWIVAGENGMEGRAIVRFSEREDVIPIFNDIANGIIRNVSVGYSVRKYEITEEKGKIQQWRAVDWIPAELSAVPIGADAAAGFRSGDNHHSNTNPCQITLLRGTTMPPEAPVAPVAPTVPVETPVATEVRTVAPVQPPVDIAEIARKAVEADRLRAAAIISTQEKLGLERSVADQLVASGATIDAARSHMIDAVAARSAKTSIVNHSPATAGGQDEKTTRRAGATSALLHRFNPRYELEGSASEMRGLTLMELAREFLQAEGRLQRGMTRDELASRALHSESDFPNVLSNVANKTLRDAYKAAPKTYEPFCRRVTATDFKKMSRMQLGEAPALEEVLENGEFKRGTLSDAKEEYGLKTYGKVLAISRQTLINDDLNAFTRLPQMFGVAAAAKESDVVWGLITANAAMGDGVALFHATHNNLAATAAAIAVASLGLMRKSMGLQVGLDGKTVINIRPKWLIVPASLEVLAEQLFAINMTPAKSSDVVPQSLRNLNVIAEPRLDASSTTAWYLMADPSDIDTIEYAYLEGQNGVFIDTRIGFDVDGMEVKARLDFGAKVIDHRGMSKNAGT